MLVLVTGSSGLIGSEAVEFFDKIGCDVVGIDNNMRADFFGIQGDTRWNRKRLESVCKKFTHIDIDIRDRDSIEKLFKTHPFELIIHAAAQPSHDLAAKRPLDDFDVNAVGTLNLLEFYRQYAPDSVFILMSTNKVYGDAPNYIKLKELETRWEYDEKEYENGIPETFPVDNCLHSLFGVSKLAADVLTQEYGRYFGLKTGIFRGGCLTGPSHSGVELHGFLNYLIIVALREEQYNIFGYKGKQVRDQIHSHDVVTALWHFACNPRCGEVYNLGGGKENAASLIECVDLIEKKSGKHPKLKYIEENRIGDHICYYSDLRKFKSHYPSWNIEYSLEGIIEEMVSKIQYNLKN